MSDGGRIVPPHISGPGEEAIPKPRPPFAYPARNPFRNDPDETEGRRLYRARAEAEARKALGMARKVTLRSAAQGIPTRKGGDGDNSAPFMGSPVAESDAPKGNRR